MSNESLVDVLKALEGQVDTLIKQLDETSAERDKLKGELENARQQNNDLARQVSSSDENKAEIRNRIQSIIEKIEAREG